MKAFLGLLLLPLLGGCVTSGNGTPTVAGGECKVFDAPQYAVRGARPYDQDWIDSTIEGGVGACKWARPAPRPPEIDAVPLPKAHPYRARPRLTIWSRVKAKAWPRKAAPVLVAPPPAEPTFVEPLPEPAPPPAPRSAIDILLHPDSK